MWIQKVQFNSSKMGKEKGWCLKNCRLAYGKASGSFNSAKDDYNWQLRNGYIHPMNTIPGGLNVAVYIDTASKYEHIGIYDNGFIWSDGIKTNLNKWKCFGWGEYCDGIRIVEWKEDTYQESFLPSRGYWKLGDTDKRIGELALFMRKTFPSYTNQNALGNYYGNNLHSSIKEFQRRTGLEVDGCIGAITYRKLQDFGFRG